MTFGVFRLLRLWLPISAAVTIACGLIYAEEQSSLREAANDPQIQMAEDAASRLAAGTPARALVSDSTVDIAASLAPFLIVYDTNGTAIGSSAHLHGGTPTLPSGVLSSARQAGEDRVTWEPASGIRIAAVVVSYAGGAVLAGRSLREVEQRESDALGLAAAGWLTAEVAAALTIFACEVIAERRYPRHRSR